MVSTGHLQLISNVELRDEIARYFNQMQLLERIIERNNREFVDNIYIPFMMRAGITLRSEPNEPLAILDRANDILVSHLGTSFVYPQDRILSAPADSD